jgi:hypothetical protein
MMNITKERGVAIMKKESAMASFSTALTTNKAIKMVFA